MLQRDGERERELMRGQPIIMAFIQKVPKCTPSAQRSHMSRHWGSETPGETERERESTCGRNNNSFHKNREIKPFDQNDNSFRLGAKLVKIVLDAFMRMLHKCVCGVRIRRDTDIALGRRAVNVNDDIYTVIIICPMGQITLHEIHFGWADFYAQFSECVCVCESQ